MEDEYEKSKKKLMKNHLNMFYKSTQHNHISKIKTKDSELDYRNINNYKNNDYQDYSISYEEEESLNHKVNINKECSQLKLNNFHLNPSKNLSQNSSKNNNFFYNNPDKSILKIISEKKIIDGKYKIKSDNNLENNSIENDFTNIKTDIKIDILNRIKKIEQNEKKKNKQLNNFIESEEEEFSAILEKTENSESEYVKDDYYSSKPKNFKQNMLPEKSERTLKKENFEKFNKIKILLCQKFLNIIVSIISSKIKKNFMIIFENSKFIEIKRLGYDLGEKNSVIFNFIY